MSGTQTMPKQLIVNTDADILFERGPLKRDGERTHGKAGAENSRPTSYHIQQ